MASRLSLVVVLVGLVWLLVSGALAHAETPTGPDAPMAVGPVDCATFVSPVVAYDVSKGQLPADVDSFLKDLGADGFSVGTINGSIPSCVRVLIVLGSSGRIGLSTAYSTADAAAIKSWVDAGHALMLFGEWGSYGGGTEAVFNAFGYSQGGPNPLTDPDDYDRIGGSDWVVFQPRNFAPHVILEGVNAAEFLSGSWLSPKASAIITSDLNSIPSQVPVMAAFLSGAGCAVLSTDSNWPSNAVPNTGAGYFKRDNALMARQAVSWLSSCGQGPVARASGPYTVSEGSRVILSGAASSSPKGLPLTYAWDLNGDGKYTDSLSVNPLFSAALLDDGIYTVSLHVSDGVYTDSGSSHVTVVNVAPVVTLTASAYAVDVGVPITLAGSFFDPGVLDTHVIQWDFGDGSPPIFGSLTRTHAYAQTGSHTVALTVTDDDGGVGTAAKSIFVVAPLSTPAHVFLPIAARNYCRTLLKLADIVLAIDTSSSMAQPLQDGGPNKLSAAQSATTVFLNLIALPGNQAAIVSFASGAILNHALSADRASLIAALQSLTAHGLTRINLALSLSRDELASARHIADNRRVLILLTDGQPNGTDTATVLAEAAAAKAEGITIYTIGLGQDVDATLLQQIATDPTYYYASPTTAQLTEIYERIADPLRCH